MDHREMGSNQSTSIFPTTGCTWGDDIQYTDMRLSTIQYLTGEFISVNTIIIEGTLAENPAYEHRERFTLGHEAAHGLIHAEYYRRKAEFAGFCDNSGGIYSRPCAPDLSGVDASGKRLQGEAWLEWQANYLAAVLLMPKAAIKNIDFKCNGRWHLELISMMVEVFNVSAQAAWVRLASLGYLPT